MKNLFEIMRDMNESTSDRMTSNLERALKREGIGFKRDDKLNHKSIKLNKNVSIGIASAFADEYTIYIKGEEKYSNSNVNSIIDYIYNNKLNEKDDTEYQKFVKHMVKKKGYESFEAIPKDEKDDFFKAVDKEWNSESEPGKDGKVNEGLNSFEKNIVKLYKQKDKIEKKQADLYNKAIKKVFSDLEKDGYKKENDYAPADDASDEEWSVWEEKESKLQDKYGSRDILKDDEVLPIVNKIWKELKVGITNQSKLKPFRDMLTDEKHKRFIVNKLQKIYLGLNESIDESLKSIQVYFNKDGKATSPVNVEASKTISKRVSDDIKKKLITTTGFFDDKKERGFVVYKDEDSYLTFVSDASDNVI